MSHQEIAVVGVARNVEATLRREIKLLYRELTKQFQKISFFVVESDSNDETIQELSKIKDEIPNFSFLTLGNVQAEIPSRIERLRFCRNKYVNWLRNSTSAYVLVCDLDIVSKHFRSDNLRQSMLNIAEWDGIFANQKGRYYDIFALRHPGWSPNDCYVEYQKLKSTMGVSEAKHQAIWSRMRRISQDACPIEVDSAFGGMALYKTWVFNKFDYSLDENSVPGECEHVTLNRKIRKVGGRLLIDPRFINFSWNSINLSYYGAFRSIEKLSKATTIQTSLRKLRKLLP